MARLRRSERNRTVEELGKGTIQMARYHRLAEVGGNHGKVINILCGVVGIICHWYLSLVDME